jgi:hypothetical protein
MLLAGGSAGGFGGAFELNCLGTQRVNAHGQAIEIATVALQAVAQTGNHLA